MTADILAFAAHPDDVELNIAGTLLATSDAGGSFAICDLTRGERGTRGSAELRSQETAQANTALGIDADRRWNLGMPDGNIGFTQENMLRVIQAIRHFRPSVVLLPWERDRHPDHEACHRLVRAACFDSGLAHVATTDHSGNPQTPHRPARTYCFFHTWETTPDIVVDITDQFQRKLDSIAAYSSQVTLLGRSTPYDTSAPETFISTAHYTEAIIARMRHWGFMIGARYGEPLMTLGGPVKVQDLMMTV